VKGIASRYPRGFLRMYVRGKLATDPVYDAIYQHLRGSDEPVIDIGCGIGILALYLRERGFKAPILGFDHDARKIEIAKRVAGTDDVSFSVADARAPIAMRGNVVLIDVLHYFTTEDQAAILRNAASAGGMILIREGIRDGSLRYRVTYAQEVLARMGGWLKAERLNFTTPGAIADLLDGEFTHELQPMFGHSPFNNYLFAFKRSSAGMTNA
jgi:2-polyprenyl-3-methyl-5-hydroxy-6-metoxy-1,4-benzoquinol methylase